MPSLARLAFEHNYGDVQRLFAIHSELVGETPGKKDGVEVLNKSAIVLMCAVWEAYCEDIAAEAVEHLVQHAKDASKLPKTLRKNIAKELKADRDDSAVWLLADDGWRAHLRARTKAMAEERNRKLNTPTTDKIKDLFDDAIGLPDVPSAWYWASTDPKKAARKLDKYVSLRGDVAHRSRAADNIKKTHAWGFANHAKRLVEKTDDYINDELRRVCGKKLF
jgi:hypothetical protein